MSNSKTTGERKDCAVRNVKNFLISTLRKKKFQASCDSLEINQAVEKQALLKREIAELTSLVRSTDD